MQLFIDNIPSMELTLNEFGIGTGIANWQPYITEERLPTDRQGRVSVRDRRRQSGHQDAVVQNDVMVQNEVAVQNNRAACCLIVVKDRPYNVRKMLSPIYSLITR